MAKVTIVPITTLTNSLSSVAAVNENFNRVAAAIEKTLTRDGTLPNNMTADLDMNSRDLLNVGIVDARDIFVDGATLQERLDYIIEVGELVAQTELDLSAYVQAAQQASASASTSATNANIAATNALNYSLAAQQAVDDIGDIAAGLDQYVIDAEAAAFAAAESADQSGGSASAAATSAGTATNAASTATGAATTAGNHATAALNSANAASGSASAAAGSVTAASGFANAAAGSADEAALEVEHAKEWATSPQDVPVSVEAGGDGVSTFSALHWAAEAAEAAGFDPLLYYTKTEVDGLIDGVEVDLSGYYTKVEVDGLIEDFVTDTDLTTALADYVEVADLATVATTGSYNDLSDLPTLGTAAAQNTTAFATAAQGALANTAVQPARTVSAGTGLTGGGDLSANRTISLDSLSIASLALADSAIQNSDLDDFLEAGDIGVTVQAYDADTAKIDAAQTWTAAQQFARTTSTITAVGALDLDCSAGNEFTKTIAANSTFTVSNVPTGQVFHLRLLLTYTSGTITLFSGIQWPKGVDPAFTSGKVYDIVLTTQDGGTTWRGVAAEFNA